MREPQSDRAEAAVEILNANGAGNVLLLCEHASHAIPERYDGLGLRPEWRKSHAAWDPGALALARELGKALDAPLVASRVSRLVYDCNRSPESKSAMPSRSEIVEIPGNAALTREEKAERVETVYRPFCEAVASRLSPAPMAIITIHSFTPVYHGAHRPTEIGILHDTDRRLADLMLARAEALPHRRIERNQPYGPEDDVTHSLKLHGIENGIANVMIEIRNNLLQGHRAIRQMSQDLLQLLQPALADLSREIAGEPLA